MSYPMPGQSAWSQPTFYPGYLPTVPVPSAWMPPATYSAYSQQPVWIPVPVYTQPQVHFSPQPLAPLPADSFKLSAPKPAALPVPVQDPPPAAVTSVKARHILIKTEAEAKDLYNQLKNGADFAQLAKAHSKCPSGKQGGGDLGFFERGQMVPEFDAIAFKSKPGDISPPFQSEFGWHILQVTDQKA